MDIDIRGIRSYDSCYFKVNDIEKYFQINNLKIILLDIKNNNYE